MGSKLYELDTEAEGFTSDATSDTPAAPDASASAPKGTSETASSSSVSSHRTPSINFLGKAGWEARKSGEAVSTTTGTNVPKNPLEVMVIQDDSVANPFYGRPSFTDDEIEALMAGGATIAPDVSYFSSGAKFQTA